MKLTYVRLCIRVGYVRDPDGNLIELDHAVEAA
jgi:hypothetical protein